MPALLEKGRRRAEAENLEVDFQAADAEDLHFDDNQFDATLSTFGVMFTTNQERAAAELLRVTRSRGRVGLANWTPDSLVGHKADDIAITRKQFKFRYASPEHFLAVFRTFYRDPSS